MKLAAKLDDLIAASVYPVTSSANETGRFGGLRTKTGLTIVDKHIDVHEEGYIIIPCKELSDDWSKESDMLSFRSLDRPFVFPGEQVHIIACLSPSKQEQAEELLIRFKKSHFFARIAEADEALWSRRKPEKGFPGLTSTIGGKFFPIESCKDAMLVDRGSLDASTCGGLAKNDVKCTMLANGDIVVLLQINIGVDSWKDPVLEILQFEKYQSTLSYETSENIDHSKQDPYGDLLKWLLPVQNSVSPPRFMSSVDTSPSATARNSLTRANSPSSFSSQNFLLGQLRSHSMSSLSSQSGSTLKNDLDAWDQVSANRSGSARSVEGLLSFRGVPLEPERFSVRCGLEGIYIPGRRWRRKIEIIQPLEVHCFAADCNTKDLLCIQIKNVSPAHVPLPDIVIYLDAITVIFEEASKGGPSMSSPVACVETGNDHGLPGLALRKGEEHSFILKPATPLWSSNAPGDRSVYVFSNVDRGASPANKYAVLVSCRSNYTESRLLFKQPTNWQPRIQKDILISVASHMSRQSIHPDDRIPNLPVQVLTLHASNLTNEDLTLTFLAPPSFSSPSVLSLNCSPPSPVSPLYEPVRVSSDRQSTALQRLWSASKLLNSNSGDDRDRKFGSFNEKTDVISDILPKSDLACIHMWLKSRVPLGCVPSRSTVTVKLELLPLTDGIITLDSLQINVEQGPSYIPEHLLKINATSSVNIGAS